MRSCLFSVILFFVLGCNGQTTSAKSDGKVYLRTYMWTGMYGTSLNISWIYLGGDGIIIKNPLYGVNPVNIAKEKKDNAKNAGTYEVKGNKLFITWSDGKKAEWKTEQKNGDFSAIDGGIVSSPKAMPADYRISGEYTASAVMPNVSSVQKLLFDKSGKFEIKQTGTVTTPDATSSSANNTQGKYEINGNTLTLTYNDGEVKKAVLAIWNMNDKDNLVINSSYYPLTK